MSLTCLYLFEVFFCLRSEKCLLPLVGQCRFIAAYAVDAHSFAGVSFLETAGDRLISDVSKVILRSENPLEHREESTKG